MISGFHVNTNSICLGFIPLANIWEIYVKDIPDTLLPEEEDKSCHASTMFNDENPTTINWFRENLVMTQNWDLNHPNDVPPNASNRFIDYHQTFAELGYKIWNIENKQHATSYLKVSCKDNTNKFITIAGRADYLITKRDITIAEYLNKTLCVIEIQSKPDITLCELQMELYLVILMNTKHLRALVGFLVLDNGLCRAFKATRDDMGDCLFEMNDLVHLTYVAGVMHSVLQDISLV